MSTPPRLLMVLVALAVLVSGCTTPENIPAADLDPRTADPRGGGAGGTNATRDDDGIGFELPGDDELETPRGHVADALPESVRHLFAIEPPAEVAALSPGGSVTRVDTRDAQREAPAMSQQAVGGLIDLGDPFEPGAPGEGTGDGEVSVPLNTGADPTNLPDLPGQNPLPTNPIELLLESRVGTTRDWHVVQYAATNFLDLDRNGALDTSVRLSAGARPAEVLIEVTDTGGAPANMTLRLHVPIGAKDLSAIGCNAQRLSVNLGFDTNGAGAPTSWKANVEWIQLETLVAGLSNPNSGTRVNVTIDIVGGKSPHGIVGGSYFAPGKTLKAKVAPNATTGAIGERDVCVPDVPAAITTSQVVVNLTSTAFPDPARIELGLATRSSENDAAAAVKWVLNDRFELSGWILTDNRTRNEGALVSFETGQFPYAGVVGFYTNDKTKTTQFEYRSDESVTVHARVLPWETPGRYTGVAAVRASGLAHNTSFVHVEDKAIRLVGTERLGGIMGIEELTFRVSPDHRKDAPPLTEWNGAPLDSYENHVDMDNTTKETWGRLYLVREVSWRLTPPPPCTESDGIFGAKIGKKIVPVDKSTPAQLPLCGEAAKPLHGIRLLSLNAEHNLWFNHTAGATSARVHVHGLPWDIRLVSDLGGVWNYAADRITQHVNATVEIRNISSASSFKGELGGFADFGTVDVIRIEVYRLTDRVTLNTDLKGNFSYLAENIHSTHVGIPNLNVSYVEGRQIGGASAPGHAAASSGPAKLKTFDLRAIDLPRWMTGTLDLNNSTMYYNAADAISLLEIRRSDHGGIGGTKAGKVPFRDLALTVVGLPPRMAAAWPKEGVEPSVRLAATDASGRPAQIGEVTLLLTSGSPVLQESEYNFHYVDTPTHAIVAARAKSLSDLTFDLRQGTEHTTSYAKEDAERASPIVRETNWSRIDIDVKGGGAENLTVFMRKQDPRDVNKDLRLDVFAKKLSGRVGFSADIHENASDITLRSGGLDNAVMVSCFGHEPTYHDELGSRTLCEGLDLWMVIPHIPPGEVKARLHGKLTQILTPGGMDVTMVAKDHRGFDKTAAWPRVIDARLKDLPQEVNLDLTEDLTRIAATGNGITGTVFVGLTEEAPKNYAYPNSAQITTSGGAIATLHAKVTGLRAFGFCQDRAVLCVDEHNNATVVLSPRTSETNKFELVLDDRVGSKVEQKLRVAIDRDLPEVFAVSFALGKPLGDTDPRHVAYHASSGIPDRGDAAVSLRLVYDITKDYTEPLKRRGMVAHDAEKNWGVGLVTAVIRELPTYWKFEWSGREGPHDYEGPDPDAKLGDCRPGWTLSILDITASQAIRFDDFRIIGYAHAAAEAPNGRLIVDNPVMSMTHADMLEINVRTGEPFRGTIWSCSEHPPSEAASSGFYIRGGDVYARAHVYKTPGDRHGNWDARVPHSWEKDNRLMLCGFSGGLFLHGIHVNGQQLPNVNEGKVRGYWGVEKLSTHQGNHKDWCVNAGLSFDEFPKHVTY